MKTTWPFLILIMVWISFACPFTSCQPDDDSDDCDTCAMVKKPNIYIYPQVATHLTIELEFPQGGHVVHSEPTYRTGWNVMVEPNGLIDKQYHYLFYESLQPNIWQSQQGWVVAKNDLKEFFEKNMAQYGFIEPEIKDFTDYWIPRLTLKPYYIIYPQTIDLIEKVIVLNVSEKPENLLRLFYLIEGSDHADVPVSIPQSPKPINRDGYTIAEWGVIND